MTQYNKIAEGYFTSTGAAKFINLPFIPDQFEIWNKTKWATATANLVRYGTSFAEDTAGTMYTLTANGASASDANVTITSGGLSFITASTYQYGPTFTISGIVAATGIVTTTAPHGYAVGDTVFLYGTTGMLQIAGTATTITAVGTTTTFTLGNIPTSGFAANATAGFCKKILYPDLYIPFGVPISGITTGTTTVITTAINHSFVVGQEVFFVIPTTTFTNTTPVWGTTQLDSAAVLAATGIPQQAYVTAVTATTITVNVNSTGFGAFTYPTSAQAALGVTYPQVLAVGDQNSGTSQVPPVTPPITIPGAFYANTRKGVLIGTGDGTTIVHATSDVIRWRAIFPDQVQTS